MKLGLFATIFAFDEDREAEPAEVRHDERRHRFGFDVRDLTGCKRETARSSRTVRVSARRGVRKSRFVGRIRLGTVAAHPCTMTDSLKDKIDHAADKAKDAADVAGQKIKEGATKVAEKAHDAADKIKDVGKDLGKKIGG